MKKPLNVSDKMMLRYLMGSKLNRDICNTSANPKCICVGPASKKLTIGTLKNAVRSERRAGK